MKNSTLAQATLLALTRQNVTQKRGPKSTYSIEATCIKRNIREGDTVIVARNEEAGITRLGDIPVSSTPLFVDSKNRLYDRVSNNLRVRDGLSGEVLSQGEYAYAFLVYDRICAHKISNQTNTWKIIYQDGSTSNPITFPFSQNPYLGYRNGILAAAKTGANFTVYTYSKDGLLLRTLASISGYSYPYAEHLFPIDEETVGVWVGYVIGPMTQMPADRYEIFRPDRHDSYGFLFSKYYSPTATTISNSSTYLGCDQNYFYALNRLHDPEDPKVYLDDRVIARFSIEDYAGAEELERYEGYNRSYFSVAATNLIGYYFRNEESLYEYHVQNRSTMQPAYSGELDNVRSSASSGPAIQENNGYIWYKTRGLYSKTAPDLVMWPSSIYPKASPFWQLGYALYSVTLGSIGEAIILFS